MSEEKLREAIAREVGRSYRYGGIDSQGNDIWVEIAWDDKDPQMKAVDFDIADAALKVLQEAREGIYRKGFAEALRLAAEECELWADDIASRSALGFEQTQALTLRDMAKVIRAIQPPQAGAKEE